MSVYILVYTLKTIIALQLLQLVILVKHNIQSFGKFRNFASSYTLDFRSAKQQIVTQKYLIVLEERLWILCASLVKLAKRQKIPSIVTFPRGNFYKSWEILVCDFSDY
jgi:hypothetical protein